MVKKDKLPVQPVSPIQTSMDFRHLVNYSGFKHVFFKMCLKSKQKCPDFRQYTKVLTSDKFLLHTSLDFTFIVLSCIKGNEQMTRQKVS